MEKYKTIHENKVMINPPDEIKRFRQSPLQRINRVLKFYHERGQNREFANKVYRNIIKKKFQSDTIKEIMRLDENDKLYENN